MSAAHDKTTCPACGSTELLTIALSLDPSGVRFRTCHACEMKWWEQGGSPVPLENVLSLVPRR